MAVNDTGGMVDSTTGGTGSTDELFDLLRHPVRRRVLGELLAVDSGDEVDTRSVSSSRREALGLYHSHLPKLAQAGYIEWSPQSHTVAPGYQLETARPIIELLIGHSTELPSGQW